MAMNKQNTLKGSFSLCGKGLHTGISLTVTFNPAPENHGYKIQRIDLDGMPIINAVAENVTDTQRGTVVAKGDVRVSTIEHAMAALYAMGIDNCLIQVNGPEFPILDGSAKMYVDKINEVGIQQQNAPKDYYIIRKKIEVRDENSGSVITILPDEEFSITAMCSYNSKFIDSQFATIDDMSQFPKEIASARTFVFVRDIMALLQAGLIKGGDLNNAIVIYENEQSQENIDNLCDKLGYERMDATKLGYLQHKPLTWENECTSHKLEIHKHEIQAPIYDPNQEPVLDVNRIRQVLPHRYPMQLVDKIISISGTTIVGVKNVTSNEPFFTGHFPEEPVMPGVLMVEAMSQCGAILVLNTLEDPERWTSYFLKIDNVKYRKKVVPGDTLIFKVELLGPVRHGISSMQGWIFVGDQLVAEATFTGQMVKNK